MSSVPMSLRRAFNTTMGCSPLIILLDWSNHSAHWPPTPFSSTATLPDCDSPLPIRILIGDPVAPYDAVVIDPTPLTFCTTVPATDDMFDDDEEEEDRDEDERREEGEEEGGGDMGQSEEEWKRGDGLGLVECE